MRAGVFEVVLHAWTVKSMYLEQEYISFKLMNFAYDIENF